MRHTKHPARSAACLRHRLLPQRPPFFVLLLLAMNPALAQPIALHPENPHLFLFRGQPTVLVTSAEHYGAVLNLDFDYRRYLNTLASEGLNYTRLFTGSYVEDVSSTFGIEHNTLAPAAGRLVVPWARSERDGPGPDGALYDLDRFDSAYFERLTDFLRLADRLDIVVEITLFSSVYQDRNWARCPLHPRNNTAGVGPADFRTAHTLENAGLFVHQDRMVREIVRRVNPFDNVFFEIQNEPWADQTRPGAWINPNNTGGRDHWATRVDVASDASLAWQHAIARAIAQEEDQLPNRHLIAQNFSNFHYPIPKVDSLVSILNFHYAWPEAVRQNYGFDRVVGFDESGFAGSDDVSYRRQAWRFMMAGGGLFNNLDYSFVVGHEDGSMPENRAPGRGSPALRSQLAVLRRFLEGFDLATLRVNPSVVTHAPGCLSYALSTPGSAVAVYLEDVGGAGRCPVEVQLNAGSWAAEWLDTATGQVVERSTVDHPGGRVRLSSPELSSEMALSLRSNPPSR